MEEVKADATCIAIVCLCFTCFVVGFCLGGGHTQREHEEMLVEKGFAHYDQKTKEFTLHEPCQGTED